MAITGRQVQKTLAVLYSLYGTRCAKCGQGIDLNLRYPHRLSGSIGHQLPQSKGGSDAIDNLRPEHLSCNVKARDTIKSPPRAPTFDPSFFGGT